MSPHQHLSKRRRNRITTTCNLLILRILHTAVILVDDVPLREALRAVEFMRLKHAHADVDNAVSHSADIH